MKSIVKKVAFDSRKYSAAKEKVIVPSDEELMQQFINGSRIAYELIVQRYKNRMFKFIYFQIKQHTEDAEDLCQEVFYQLYKNSLNFRSESKFSTYLYSIAKNIVLNYYRTNSRRDIKYDLQKNEDIIDVDCLHKRVNNENNQHQFTIALNNLSFDERQIIFLCDKEGFSYSQISQILNINIGTVRSRLNSARNKMINYLREYHYEVQ